MRKFIFYCLFIFTCIKNNAQRIHTSNNNLWLVYSGDHKIAESKFGVHIEYQERRANFGLNNQQNLARIAINYHFLPQAFFSLGYCFVQTYPYGEFPVLAEFSESRPYQQLQITNLLGKVEAVSRFRMEERWSYLPYKNFDGTIARSKIAIYTNRVRWMQRFSFPLCKAGIIDNKLYITAYNEIFISFGKNVQKNMFDQNRAFIGIGYKVKNFGRLELGYLNHTLFKPDGIKVEDNHTINFTILSNFGFKKKKEI